MKLVKLGNVHVNPDNIIYIKRTSVSSCVILFLNGTPFEVGHKIDDVLDALKTGKSLE